jgi:hypothetical protein
MKRIAHFAGRRPQETSRLPPRRAIQQRHSRFDEHQIRLQIHNLEELRITKGSQLILYAIQHAINPRLAYHKSCDQAGVLDILSTVALDSGQRHRAK